MMKSIYNAGKSFCVYVAKIRDINSHSEYFAVMKDNSETVKVHNSFVAYYDFDTAQDMLDLRADRMGWRWCGKHKTLPVFEFKDGRYYEVTP